jgi:hypothetical protein
MAEVPLASFYSKQMENGARISSSTIDRIFDSLLISASQMHCTLVFLTPHQMTLKNLHQASKQEIPATTY